LPIEKKIKLGLIGAGKWGINYIKTIEKLKEISLVAVSSRNKTIKNIIPKDCVLYEDWKQIFMSKEIDGIIVSSPTDTHYKICKEIINRKIPLLSEKPLATNIEEVKNLLELCKRGKTILMVNYIHLYHHEFKKIEKIIQRNNFSRLRNINSESGNYGPFRKDTRALWDWGVHDIAMTLKLSREYPYKVESKYLKVSSKGFMHGEIIEAKLYFPSNMKAILNFGNLKERKIKKFTASTDLKSFIYDPFNEKNNVNIAINDQPLGNCIKEFAEKINNKLISFKDIELTLQITKVIHTIENQLKQ